MGQAATCWKGAGCVKLMLFMLMFLWGLGLTGGTVTGREQGGVVKRIQTIPGVSEEVRRSIVLCPQTSAKRCCDGAQGSVSSEKVGQRVRVCVALGSAHLPVRNRHPSSLVCASVSRFNNCI